MSAPQALIYGAGITLLICAVILAVAVLVDALLPNLSRIWSALRGRGA